MREFDAVVIGSGSAGTSAATALRKRGLGVAVVDERPFGGTCALRGCDPKKVLVAAARAVNEAQRYRAIGVFKQTPQIDWQSLMRFKRTFTDPVPQSRRKTLEDAGIVAMQAEARFVNETTLDVGGEQVAAKHVVIATGARELHVAQGDDALLTSETFLDAQSLPESLVFIGGGYIAFEFAHVAARAGSRVTILNDGDMPLRGFDADAVGKLLDATREYGIDVELGTRVESVERTAGGIAVHARVKDGSRTFEARGGVLAAGRVPDVDRLDLPAAGIERTKKGVQVNAYLQSVSNPRVYAAGDCADGGGLPLTPVAGYEGDLAALNILDGNKHERYFRGLASMVYAIPALGQVGLTQAQAREQGIDVETNSGDMSEWYSTRHLAAKHGFYKVVLEKGTGKILGAAIFGPHAEEQLNVFALALRGGMRREDLSGAFFAYPTGSSDISYML